MQTIIRTLIILWLGIQSTSAQIVLRDAKDAPVPIAIQEFLSAADTPENKNQTTSVEAALTANLIFSRIFRVIPAEAFLAPPVTSQLDVIQVDPWKQIGAQYVVRGRVTIDGSQVNLEGFAFNILTGKLEIRKVYKARLRDAVQTAHMFGDDIVELVTGQKGLFSTKIAFVYVPPGKRFKEIWVADFNGRNARPLVQNNRTNLSPTWSPDGKYIYYSSSSQVDWHLWRTDLNGNSKQITRYKGSALGPVVMPNGKEIVISLSKDGNPDLYLIDLDGKEKKRLTTRRGININPSPTADGSKLCFSSDRLGNLHIFSLDMATLETERLTRLGTLNDSCTWHPFDNTILFSGMDTDREFDIFEMNDRGLDMVRRTHDNRHNESPDFSPDGKLVVFNTRRAGRNQVYVMRGDGTQASSLFELPGESTQPSWSPRLGYR
jgi:TolB protein